MEDPRFGHIYDRDKRKMLTEATSLPAASHARGVRAIIVFCLALLACPVARAQMAQESPASPVIVGELEAPVTFGVKPAHPHNYFPKVFFPSFARGAPFLSIKRSDQEDCPHCDVTIILEGTSALFGQTNTAQAYSARSGRLLYTAKSRGNCGGAACRQLGREIYDAFAPGTESYRKIVAEREAARKRQTPAAGGMSPAELEAIVRAAVQGNSQAARREGVEAQPRPVPASDVDQPKYHVPKNKDQFALVVGVERYNGMPEAQFAERDAKAVREHLRGLGYPDRNIVLLMGTEASRAGLVKNLETRLPRLVNERSTVFFYYSGHGAPNPQTGEAYLLPSDGDPQFLEDTAYPLKRLYEKLNALKAKRVIAAIDSCFSGLGGRSVLAKGTRPLVHKVNVAESGVGKVVALTASQGNEISGTIDEQGHGAFTYFLLRGLNGAAKNEEGRVTVRSLHDYLVPNVQDAARRQNRDQTPQLLPVDFSVKMDSVLK